MKILLFGSIASGKTTLTRKILAIQKNFDFIAIIINFIDNYIKFLKKNMNLRENKLVLPFCYSIHNKN